MKDSTLMSIARSIDRHNEQIEKLITRVFESTHPEAHKIAEKLLDQCCQPASAIDIVRKSLSNPERWDGLGNELR